MTEEEQAYLNKLKNNPEDPVFQMLFYLDPDGNPVLRAGVGFQLMPDGIPFVFKGSNYASQEGSYNFIDPFQKTLPQNSLGEISNAYAMDSPFGKRSAFYTPPKEGFSLSRSSELISGLKSK